MRRGRFARAVEHEVYRHVDWRYGRPNMAAIACAVARRFRGRITHRSPDVAVIRFKYSTLTLDIQGGEVRARWSRW